MASLKVPRNEGRSRIAAQVTRANQLLERSSELQSDDDYVVWREDRERWVLLTADVLTSVFEGDDAADEFRSANAPTHVVSVDWGWEDAAGEVAGRTRSGVNRLRSLMERVEYATEPEPPRAASETAPSSLDEGGPIFLVHGHNEGALHYVARVVADSTGREVVILREKANRGLTLLEKLEQHAQKAAYAVVLLTADDEGRAVSSSEAEPRARQNVVFELGLFFGLLGRDRVAVLYEANVELPTDLHGLVYIELDEGGAWKQNCATRRHMTGWGERTRPRPP